MKHKYVIQRNTIQKNADFYTHTHTVQAALQITITGKALAIAYQQTFDDDDLYVQSNTR